MDIHPNKTDKHNKCGVIVMVFNQNVVTNILIPFNCLLAIIEYYCIL